MKRLITLSIFMSLAYPVFCQPNELVYKKLITTATNKFEKLDDGSGYVLSFYNVLIFDLPVTNIGIWTDIDHYWTVNDTTYWGLTLVYNSDLTPIGEMNLGCCSDNVGTFPFSNQRMVIQVQDWLTYTLPSSTIPIISNFSAAEPVEVGYFTYNALNDSAYGMFYYTKTGSVDMTFWPFAGYVFSVYDTNGFLRHRSSAVLNDSLFISYLNLTGNQSLNNTLNFSGYGNEINLVRAQYNFNTNEITAQQIGSNSGSLATFAVEPSEGGDEIYRIGMVRGNNTPLSISGSQLEIVPNDSLYHIFMTKESAQGNTEWLTELYAYNNTGPDTTVYLNSCRVSNVPNSIVEDDGDVFVSMYTKVYAPYGDSLLYRDFLGNDMLSYDLLPNSNSDSSTYQIPFARVNLFKINEAGNIIKNLRYTPSLLYNYVSQFYLYKVADKLAWVFYHNYTNDSTVDFTSVNPGGSTQNTSIEFPAGRGISVLWLNTDLEILDNWTISYSVPGFPDSSPDNGLSINAIYPYHGDTLLIQGNIKSGTVTSLDPFGQSEEISPSTTGSSSFFAFYSAPEILTNTPKIEELANLSVFPNPTEGELHISGVAAENSRYRIFDISGRMVQAGMLDGELLVNTSHLTSGMYILRIDAGKGSGSRKFVVK